MKLCINCRWCSAKTKEAGYFQCTSPKNESSRDPVNGEVTRKYVFCSTLRSGSKIDAVLFGGCGPQGRWFEPKDSGEPLVAEAQKDEAA